MAWRWRPAGPRMFGNIPIASNDEPAAPPGEQAWSEHWQAEVEHALRRCVVPAGVEDRGLALCVATNDPILAAFRTLDRMMERTGITVKWREAKVHTFDVQVRDRDDCVVAAFELKTIPDYISAMGASKEIESPPCKLSVGRMAAQRERGDELGCRVWWIIKGVQTPAELPRDLVSSLTSMELLNERQSYRVAANDADVIRQILIVLGKLMKGPHHKHHKAVLVDRPNSEAIARDPLLWLLVAAPRMTPESAAVPAKTYKSMHNLIMQADALPIAKRGRMLADLPCKLATGTDATPRRLGNKTSEGVLRFLGVPLEDASLPPKKRKKPAPEAPPTSSDDE
jgi:hypothetical protein